MHADQEAAPIRRIGEHTGGKREHGDRESDRSLDQGSIAEEANAIARYRKAR
ncbi:hypothetical protein [Pseudofrankia sp. BMG5.36]|uniref:hypothetical protein n=1 Tax=Pseudofrankia sp. BMG5.36 TaxID=1834512 RepID=UPI0018E37ECD|nr:hypothetical protein [Pseudofrankia sp. BMG5.36]